MPHKPQFYWRQQWLLNTFMSCCFPVSVFHHSAACVCWRRNGSTIADSKVRGAMLAPWNLLSGILRWFDQSVRTVMLDFLFNRTLYFAWNVLKHFPIPLISITHTWSKIPWLSAICSSAWCKQSGKRYHYQLSKWWGDRWACPTACWLRSS